MLRKFFVTAIVATTILVQQSLAEQPLVPVQRAQVLPGPVDVQLEAPAPPVAASQHHAAHPIPGTGLWDTYGRIKAHKSQVWVPVQIPVETERVVNVTRYEQRVEEVLQQFYDPCYGTVWTPVKHIRWVPITQAVREKVTVPKTVWQQQEKVTYKEEQVPYEIPYGR